MKQVLADKILEIGILLTSEKNYGKLLSKIVDVAMELTNSDGGTLYLYDEEELKFCITKTESMGIDMRGTQVQKYPPVSMDEKNVCAYSGIHRKLLNIEDVYSCDEFDFSGPKVYDKLTGYHTQSVLVFPLINHEGNLVGVVELINSQNEAGEVIPFAEEYEQVLESVGSLAAVAVSNMIFVREIEQLMVSMTQVFTGAIDTRIPYNYFHSRNVYLYVKMLVDYMNSKHQEGKCEHFFTPEKRDEILMAALMHDIGKLVIPEEIINKVTRLSNELALLQERYKYLECLYRIDYLEGRISEEKWLAVQARLKEAGERIVEINQKHGLEDEDIAFVEALAMEKHCAEDGTVVEFLTARESECLKVRRGTLTAKEREVVCSHVEYTERYLHQMNFEHRYPHIAEWAGAHHELLDGSGYPRGLKGDEIPMEARILAIVDVFEALTSSDRPYKESMEEKRALAILEDMAEKGKLDRELLGLFKEALEEDGVNMHMRLFHQ